MVEKILKFLLRELTISNVLCRKMNNNNNKDVIMTDINRISSFTFQIGTDEQLVKKDRLKLFKISNLLSGAKELNDDMLLQCSSSLKESWIVGNHSLVHSAAKAYNNHHHLTLRPDDIWMAIMTQFGIYVNQHAKSLQSLFVDFQGQRELVLRLDNASLTVAPYDSIVHLMSDMIAENIKDETLRQWVIPGFSTTTDSDRVVGGIVLMSTMSQYFKYRVEMECGLPKVTLEGSVEDWENLYQRTQRLLQYDNPTSGGYMKKWVLMLNPVLQQFIQTAQGRPNTEWWNRISNYISGGSGPTWLNGWITCFCVFDHKGTWIGDTKSIITDEDEYYHTEWLFIDTQNIPPGYLTVPLKVVDNQIPFQTRLYAGHLTSDINQSTITPRLDWFIILENK
ncbi:hypothetical protein DLAC_01715 [Tieghemostelium lacteum]|uniref:DUF4419 domain-containing protein n=1 Tax=Tieghemostelium lacteum TaxID=361077 RepID=A0A152A644_TIELA|nr:hypothetical protein DLAC_01715 [Tieghemostelium lacteum]|eukprot:KYR01706.1 hypothetical protein DLAC_01715 [Tieghemostelium lacteum]